MSKVMRSEGADTPMKTANIVIPKKDMGNLQIANGVARA